MIKENQISNTPSEKDSFEFKTIIIKDTSLVNIVLEDLKQWKSCTHPNISHLESFKFDQIEGSYPSVNYTIEKVPLSLLDIIEERADIRNHFTPEEYVIYCLQLLSGLSYLHKKNIPHKSLRLSNVLITSTGELKLTNLVNLNIYEEISTSSLNISPELQGIKGKIGTNEFFKMDIWRLGMLFIELAKLSKLEEFVKSDNKFEGFPESYGKKIPKIILQMIESDPNRRFSLKKVFDDFKKISKQLNIKEELWLISKKKEENKAGEEEEKKVEEKKPKKTRPVRTFEVMPSSEVEKYYNDEGKFGGDGKINKDTLKISTWNVNSLINVLTSFDKKDNPLLNYFKEDFDFICLTETHLKYEQLSSDVLNNFISSDYIKFYNCHKGNIGRSGVATFTKYKPISVIYDLGVPEHDNEGRIITLEYEKFFLVNCYTPNSGRELQRLEYRTTKWDPDFRAFIKRLREKKHVVLCGDLNVAHTKIDVHVQKRYAGATDEERTEFTLLLKEGFVDAFRFLYPKDKEYTFFSSYFDARAENKGWRLDYFVLDNGAIKGAKDVKMRKEVVGSDHCPLEMIFDQSKLE